MKIKPYIAVFFVLIFFGKFLMLDSKFLGSILESENIAWVNTYCENNPLGSSEENIPDDLEQASNVLVLNTDAICNAPFHFSENNWPESQSEPNFQHIDYRNTPVISAYPDKFYPPPKVLIA